MKMEIRRFVAVGVAAPVLLGVGCFPIQSEPISVAMARSRASEVLQNLGIQVPARVSVSTSGTLDNECWHVAFLIHKSMGYSVRVLKSSGKVRSLSFGYRSWERMRGHYRPAAHAIQTLAQARLRCESILAALNPGRTVGPLTVAFATSTEDPQGIPGIVTMRCSIRINGKRHFEGFRGVSAEIDRGDGAILRLSQSWDTLPIEAVPQVRSEAQIRLDYERHFDRPPSPGMIVELGYVKNRAKSHIKLGYAFVTADKKYIAYFDAETGEYLRSFY